MHSHQPVRIWLREDNLAKGAIAVFIITAKVSRRKLALGATAVVLLCCTALALRLAVHPSWTVFADQSPSSSGIKNNEARIEYLHAYGWEVSPDPIATQEFIIPAKPEDESLAEYLALQAQQGFDLSKYAGKRVKRYTYEVTNYPSGESGIQANLLIYRGTVVGGEILSPQLDGFLHGLTRPSETS